MRLMWSGYQYRRHDGYGRYGTYMVKALLKAGVDVTPVLEEELNMPQWMQEMRGTRFDDRLTISCLPPYFLQKAPGRHWLLTMTEGDALPSGWLQCIERAGVERVVVPCQHNADAFARGGVKVPIHVIPGGTDPDDFPVRHTTRQGRPYTFLTLADRGQRKGWNEVWQAFFAEFGSRHDTADVRLLIKCRPQGNDLIDMMRHADNPDPRITFLVDDAEDIALVFTHVDCLAIPARSEGFGMFPREGAMSGLPVITQRYSGMDDGFTHEWAMVVEGGQMEPIGSAKDSHIKGNWRRADVKELGAKMRWCYENPEAAKQHGLKAAAWLRANQTWRTSCNKLLDLMIREGVFEPEREYA